MRGRYTLGSHLIRIGALRHRFIGEVSGCWAPRDTQECGHIIIYSALSDYRLTRDTATLVISVAFYMIENKACGDNADLVVDRLCKLCVRVYKLKKWDIHVEIMQVCTCAGGLPRL